MGTSKRCGDGRGIGRGSGRGSGRGGGAVVVELSTAGVERGAVTVVVEVVKELSAAVAKLVAVVVVMVVVVMVVVVVVVMVGAIATRGGGVGCGSKWLILLQYCGGEASVADLATRRSLLLNFPIARPGQIRRLQCVKGAQGVKGV